MNTTHLTHLLASAPAALLLTGKARDAGNVTCAGASLAFRGPPDRVFGSLARIVLSGK